MVDAEKRLPFHDVSGRIVTLMIDSGVMPDSNVQGPSMKKSEKNTKSAPPAYRDASLPVGERVEDLLSRMTLEEKIGQINQLPVFMKLDEEVVERGLGSILCGTDEDVERYQRLAVEKTRLGIPLLVGVDAIHGHSMEHNATLFPSQLALSCSWDEGLAHDVARATAEEMAHTGCSWTFSPVLCMARDLRWGRVDETFGEDPLLIGRLASAMIRGYQGGDLSRPDCVAACAKHFCGYGETSGGREASEANYSRRYFESLFLPPFEEAAKAGVASFMTAYHAIDGVPCTINRWLLHDVLRDRWHSDAMVVTDWANICHLVHEQRIAPTTNEVTAQALIAGNDMSMTDGDFVADALNAVHDGRLPMEVVDEHVRRVLALKFRLGLFENPRYPSAVGRAKTVGTAAHHRLALRAARESAVLLKNDHLLPLRMETIRTIAVIGPNADDDVEQIGDWAVGANQGQGVMARNERSCTKTVLDGVLAEFGKEAKVTFARGAGISESRPERIARAVRLAEEADVVVLVLGDNLRTTGEAHSTATLELQGDQLALVDALAATGTPIACVFLASKPLVLTKVAPKVDALLCVFNPGMEGGEAIADILRGRVNPQGRLSVSFPAHAGQQPVAYSQVEGAHHSSYPDLPGTGFYGLFPFGFGLSYTSFKYLFPHVEKAECRRNEPVRLTVTLRNTGNREGVETVQVYMRDLYASMTLPAKRLVAFRRVSLKPREQTDVVFEIPPEAFSFVDADCNRVLEPGDFDLMVGSSSQSFQTVRFRYLP